MRQCILAQGLLLFAFSAQAANTQTSNHFSLTSDGLLDKGSIPVVYTCDSLDISPQLQWSNVPVNTQSLALVVTDSDAPGFYHWIVYNIPPTTLNFDQQIQEYPQGTAVGRNSSNKNQYYGPCPPKGALHHYQFTLYALDTHLSLSADADGRTVLNAVKGHVLKEATLTATYSRIE